MHSVSIGVDTTTARPTQLIAEALLDQHDSFELISRAKRLGFSSDLTEVVVKVCCRDRHEQAAASASTASTLS